MNTIAVVFRLAFIASFLAVSAIVLVKAAPDAFEAFQLLIGGVETNGTVVSVAKFDYRASSSRKPQRRPVVEFFAEGKKYRFTETTGLWSPRLDPGPNVSVVYLQSRPAVASINSYWYIWGNTLVALMVAGIFGSIALRIGFSQLVRSRLKHTKKLPGGV